jgi:hypothetical protein
MHNYSSTAPTAYYDASQMTLLDLEGSNNSKHGADINAFLRASKAT